MSIVLDEDDNKAGEGVNHMRTRVDNRIRKIGIFAGVLYGRP